MVSPWLSHRSLDLTSAPAYFETMRSLQNYFTERGASVVDAQPQAMGFIGRQVDMRERYLAYIDVPWVSVLVSVLAIPLALILRNVEVKEDNETH